MALIVLGLLAGRLDGIVGASIVAVAVGVAILSLVVAYRNHAAGQRLIAENSRISRELARKAQRLEGILDNLAQGVCVYDKDLRLDAWSRGFVDMFELSEAWLQTRPSLEEFMRLLAQKGEYRETDIDALITTRVAAARVQREAEHFERVRADGSILDIHSQPLPDGGMLLSFRDTAEREQATATTKPLVQVDSLTGLANRTAFNAQLFAKLADAERSGHLVSIMILDLDNFKDINDAVGHPFGDKLLIEVAKRLVRCAHSSDLVARLGGDEFAIVSTHYQAGDQVTVMAERLLEAVREPIHLKDRELRVTVSIGITVYAKVPGSIDQLLRDSNIALYRAKQAGRNNYRFYEADMRRKVEDHKLLEHEMLTAIKRGEFEAYYQPKIDVASGRVIGAEALIRWHNPKRGMVLPAEFIPIAEKSGLIMPMSRWILKAACREAKSWQRQGLPSMSVAVNISPVHFTSSEFVNEIAGVLEESGLAPEFLELEITERMVMPRSGGVVATLEALRALGVSLSIDDFGTGYSSLARLKRFPVDKLKIDQSFVRELEAGSDDAAIVKTIVSMGQTLGMTVIAEGVETAEQFALLKNIGCDQAQGYHFSRPIPAPDFRQWVADYSSLEAAVGV